MFWSNTFKSCWVPSADLILRLVLADWGTWNIRSAFPVFGRDSKLCLRHCSELVRAPGSTVVHVPLSLWGAHVFVFIGQYFLIVKKMVFLLSESLLNYAHKQKKPSQKVSSKQK